MGFVTELTVMSAALLVVIVAQPSTKSSEDSQGVIAISLRSEHQVALLDLTDYQILGRIPTGKGPHELAISAQSSIGFVANYGLYPKPHAEKMLSGRPEWESVPSNSITVIDFDRRRVLRTLLLGDCTRPHGVWGSKDGRTVWTTCEEAQAVREVDAITGVTLNEWTTNQSVSHIVIASPDERKLYVANTGSGSVTIIDRIADRIRTVPTGAGAEGLAISPDGQELWVANNQANTISIIDLQSELVATSFPAAGRFPIRLEFSPDGSEIWVANNMSNDLSIYGTASRSLVGTIELGTSPLGLLITPDGERAHVTVPRWNAVITIDTRSREVVGTHRVGIEPDGMAWIER